MSKFMTDKGNLCWADGHFFRNFAGRSPRQKIILILFITATVLSSTASPAPENNQAGINVILLQNRQFIPEVIVKPSISKITGHAIIQFEEEPNDTIVDILASHQVNVLEWIPRNAVMAYIPEAAQVESIPGIRWVGKLEPADKISAHLNKSLTKGFILVDVFPDVNNQHVQSIISASHGSVIENSYLGPRTFLVRADQEVVTKLSRADEVSWIWPASDAIINGDPVRRCPGVMTTFGVLPNYVTINEGWDGPGQGSASLKYHFVNGTFDMSGEKGIVEDALYEWAKYAQITWTETTYANQNRSIDIKWATYSHGDGKPFDGPDGVMAHAFSPPPDTSETFAGDLHFDDSEVWDDYCYYWSPTDLYSIALHEAGHSLGLDHSYNPDAVMYTPFNPYIHCYRSLHQDDIDGIRSIYASRYPSCSITVTSPTSSSNWATGTSHTIMWNSSGNPGSYVKIQLYKGSSLRETIISSTYDDGTYSWTPSTSLPDGSDYRIKISATTDSSCYDYSSYFTIYTPCSITLSSPSGGSWWELGETLAIIWDSEYTSGDVKIELYKGSSLDRIITPSTSDNGVYDWPIPDDGSLTGDCDYRIKITDISSSSCNDYSAYFCIATPPEAQDGSFTTYVDTPVTINLQATDEGQPDPPAALTYIITSLPIYGDLNDPCAGLINDPHTPLANNGNKVEYIPDIDYEGQDSFTFIANDGGSPPGGGNSNEATVTINVTACVFFDDFPSSSLDTTNWTATSGTPTVDDTAGNEPSPPYSLHLEAVDSVTSRMVDLYGCWSAQLNYWWKRVGTESGDDLYVDYWDGNEWKALQVLPSGADTIWEPNSLELPADALHSEFRLRFRADCDASSDEWYIDEVCIQCQSCVEPPVLQAEVNTTQGMCNTIYWDPVADANEYYAECANDANFANTDANSDWITDTNYEFCGLALGETYWYRVMAWAPFSLKTWLQTTQTDFETDTLTDTIATSDGNVLLTGGGATIFQDDFEDGSYDGWTTGTGSCTREVTDETAAAGTTYSLTQTGPCPHYQGMYYTFAPLTPDRVTFHVRTESMGASGYVVLVGSDTSHRIVWFYMQDNKIRVVQDRTYSTSCNLLTWYKVDFVFNWQAKTFAFYVDDGLVAGNIPFRDPGVDSLETIYLHDLFGTQSWWDEIEFSTGSGGGYTPIGDIVSTVINLPADGNWVVVDFNTTTPADTELTIDILPAAGSTPIPDYENVSSGADLSGIGDLTIRLRANLSTSDTNNTPVLHNWLVTYTDSALACESEWSNVESSLQCRHISGDFEPDCDVDMLDLRILCEEWLSVLSWDVWPEGGDAFVDFSDYSILADGWQTSYDYDDLAEFVEQWLGGGANYCIADIAPDGGNGIVNMLDFALLAENWMAGP
ncbi:MAG: matrixin family metalloprotease [Candidatus Hodarchaeales archaeon]|jgi:hypothetical protein